jgi:GNAT superfamily N-acetyltransferase
MFLPEESASTMQTPISLDDGEHSMTVVGYEISTDQDRIDVDVVFHFLSEESYWSPGIPRHVVAKAIENSLCFGAHCGDDQVGFARIVTDRATFAFVADVFVVEKHRGKGLAKWLIQEVVNHPELQGLRRILLLTSDAHSLYARFGFVEIVDSWRFMERLQTGDILRT